MRERPILFSSDMVNAILAGRKTMTRRVVKLNDGGRYLVVGRGRGYQSVVEMHEHGPMWRPYGGSPLVPYPAEKVAAACPYGQPGDRLWVRETFWSKHDTDSDGYQSIDCGPYLDGGPDYCPGWDYCATPECFNPPTPEREQRVTAYSGEPTPGDWWLAPPDDWNGEDDERNQRGTWEFVPWGSMFTKHPSIHMPRWTSRITLEITGVRVERLQEISEADAQAEGCAAGFGPLGLGDRISSMQTARERFRYLWDSLNRERGYGWDTNPWVWVIEFRKVVA